MGKKSRRPGRAARHERVASERSAELELEAELLERPDTWYRRVAGGTVYVRGPVASAPVDVAVLADLLESVRRSFAGEPHEKDPRFTGCSVGFLGRIRDDFGAAVDALASLVGELRGHVADVSQESPLRGNLCSAHVSARPPLARAGTLAPATRRTVA